MLGTLAPQEAINRGLPKPSECDIVVVILWSRMGTPFIDTDGTNYLSGTHWELLNALGSNRPEILIFRRTEEKLFKSNERKEQDQNEKVKEFFASDLFYRDDGTIRRGFNTYEKPDDFRRDFETFFEESVVRLLERYRNSKVELSESYQTENITTITTKLWEVSPFPGLRAFTEADAPIFFGRGREIDELIAQLVRSRFVAVVAASGSGKSSLVAAGLIPRLKANAIVIGETGSIDWRHVRLTLRQEENPFTGLYVALYKAFPEYKIAASNAGKDKREFVTNITQNPRDLLDIVDMLLHEVKAPAWAEVLFFIDQFEELFTLVSEENRTIFVDLLEAINASRRLRCIVTMRSDFTPQALNNTKLAALINAGNYMLSAPTAGALVEMIKRPAERADLTWDEGLPERIQMDTGSNAGALALMAFALDELYQTSGTNKSLTFETYRHIGGVEGAIGKRAELAFEFLNLVGKDRLRQRIFRELVTVDESGKATRLSARLSKFSADERTLIQAFADARLLVTYDDVLEVAHDAVLRSWDWLKNWIVEAQEDLIMLRQLRTSANEWQRNGRPDPWRWPAERLELLSPIIERQQPTLTDVEQDFIEPEQDRLLREIADPQTSHKRRRTIGERLDTIRDTRTGIGLTEHSFPQIDWLYFAYGGEIDIESHPYMVQPFYVSKYLVTYAQFQSFVDAHDGFENNDWWKDFPARYHKQPIASAVAQYNNYPRDSVSWYQSVAFSRWLHAKYQDYGLFEQFSTGNWQIRLPTEWEWQWMAQNGNESRLFPWGDWDDSRANTINAGIQDRSTAVGMYFDGRSACEALDVAGNLWEWCINDYESDYSENDQPKALRVDGFENDQPKVLRGGSFHEEYAHATCSYRYYELPYYGPFDTGFRLVVGQPLSPLV